MDRQHERRNASDRRDRAVFCHFGYERRNHTGNRRFDMAAVDQPNTKRGSSFDHKETSGDAVAVAKEIAEAFGLPPALLEVVEHDDLLITTEHCQFCADRERKCAKLEEELARSRKEAEQYRSQVRELLLSLDISRQ